MKNQLQAFSKRRKSKSDFVSRVLAVVRAIPRGKTLSYAAVAKKAGSPGAARAVGSLMAKNFDPKIPCHRVVHSDGTVGNYNRGGPNAKQLLLRSEQAGKKG